MEFTSKGVLLDIEKALIVTVRHEDDISVVAKQNWINVEESNSKIVDDKLQSEDVTKTQKQNDQLAIDWRWQWELHKLCQILQNSIEHKDIEVFYRNYLKNLVF